jgi:hypothetical protein
MRIADAIVLAALAALDLPLQQLADSLCWLTVIMTLFYTSDVA